MHDNVPVGGLLSSTPPCQFGECLLTDCETSCIRSPQELQRKGPSGPFWLQQATSAAPGPLVYANAQEARRATGTADLSPRETARRRRFHSAASVAWPVPHYEQSQQEWRGAIMGYLNAMAFRIMKTRDLQPAITPLQPSLAREEVLEALLTVVDAEGGEYIEAWNWKASSRGSYRWTADGPQRFTPTSARISGEDIDKLCREVVDSCWQQYDSRVYEELSRVGRKGGRKSKRLPTYTPDALDAHLGRSKKQQAANLGCSERTVAKLRAKHPYYQPDA